LEINRSWIAKAWEKSDCSSFRGVSRPPGPGQSVYLSSFRERLDWPGRWPSARDRLQLLGMRLGGEPSRGTKARRTSLVLNVEVLDSRIAALGRFPKILVDPTRVCSCSGDADGAGSENDQSRNNKYLFAGNLPVAIYVRHHCPLLHGTFSSSSTIDKIHRKHSRGLHDRISMTAPL
jgi:hypothetical protein